ncbi:hypothetical protein [Phytomonospora endophytica]|uniref:Putative membrane protein n=1 Tax=Phytomonospora endophytica TaxID=714109 RepID=A0A841FS53_9ACTN|nr:hypothetical protein [Phytomonospora endophytica]MBB6036137.1 putative membrane protein [Phytomonospora endophytica]GIG67040.1 hypothetical protein Pen01_33350 [Phytomonospora endophytica]
MKSKLSARYLVALSMVYGVVIAAMAVFDVPGMSAAAIIGAMVIGLAWAMWGLFANRRDQPGKE